MRTERFRTKIVGKAFEMPQGEISALVDLGAPVLADVDLIVTTTNMKVGSYTIAAQPDIARNITVTRTAVGAADTGGTVTITGTDAGGTVITETITVGADGVTVAGTKAFKTVTSVVGAGWIIDAPAGEDTITVGVGDELGLPAAAQAVGDIILGILGTTITAHNPTVTDPASIYGTTVDMSAGTYDGTKHAYVFVKG